MNDIFIFNTAKLAVRSVITAASTHPGPGLVTPVQNDALDGTDFQSLLDGALALFPCFINCASLGFETEEMTPDEVMTLLRPAGRHGEQDVLCATRGKIALRGRIFLLGLLCAAAGRLTAQKRNLTPMALGLTGSSFARGIIERDLWSLEENADKIDTMDKTNENKNENGNTGAEQGQAENITRTAGEKAYMLYGTDGCRGEAERGFPLTLRAAGMLKNLEGTHGHLALRERTAHVLLRIMIENADTTLAAREGIDGMLRAQGAARDAVAAGGMLSPQGRDAVARMDNEFRSRGTSPRGSAVILSAALFILSLGDLKLTRSGLDE